MVQPGERGCTGQVLLGVERSPLNTEFAQKIPASAHGVMRVCRP
jgi:hypothetical protein